jgi:hypothetical protein
MFQAMVASPAVLAACPLNVVVVEIVVAMAETVAKIVERTVVRIVVKIARTVVVNQPSYTFLLLSE